MVLQSVIEDAEVPTREVSKEHCLLVKSGVENVEAAYVVGVMIDDCGGIVKTAPLWSTKIVGVSLESEDLVIVDARGSS